MSNTERDAFVENVTHWVTELWELEARQDLLEDCVDYIANELEDHVLSNSYVTYLELLLSYFQSISSNAISNTDLNHMAEERYA